ncbi:MAG: Crp/Fnr family transcriptional regulator [Undibacterium sp.]|uniref:Crp/Fnr family transcriptional regulator n=1 Tax=Undibacterium sp. TaxID=1914977 RepID=UPI00272004DC|nr:Crp/Fnr family transcriptional regulator [Undibacterium sp.]MDO8651846.1 Crp/Fnr family transcriptional regulator [Undibacterium sp.]
MLATFASHHNKLLAALPEAVFNRLLPHLERVDLTLGQMLYESGSALKFVYFPTTAIVSLLHVMADGASAEIALVGQDGIVGIAIFMGGESTTHQAIVQRAGIVYRMPVAVLKKEFASRSELQQLLLRYTQALFTQTAQTAACNRHHSIDQQLCRWLLASQDLLASTTLVMTQELISNMLGVRRQGVAEAAKKLQLAGLIQYNRGHIKVLDRSRLEDRVCECYMAVKQEYQRLMSTPLLAIG